MIELEVYAKLAIPTRANVCLTVQAVLNCRDGRLLEASEGSNYSSSTSLQTRLQDHLVESVRKDECAYMKIGEKLLLKRT